LADYGVKTRHCQLCGASLLRFLVEMFPASLHLRQKTQVLQEIVKIYSLVFSILACDWQLQKKSYGRLSGNNRPITDYLKNGRLIGFAHYLPINRLIPTIQYVLFFSLKPYKRKLFSASADRTVKAFDMKVSFDILYDFLHPSLLVCVTL
jgi:hypothetical protein